MFRYWHVIKILPTSPKTANYISSGGVLVTRLHTVNRVIDNVSAARTFESFEKKTLICSAIIVYSLAIPCFSSRRVSIDSRVWNRNADNWFFRNVCWKIRCVPRQGAVGEVYTRSVDAVNIEYMAKKCKYYIDIHKKWCALRKLREVHVSKTELRRVLFTSWHCVQARHTCRDLDYCSKQRCGTSQHAIIIASYYCSVKRWNVLLIWN